MRKPGHECRTPAAERQRLWTRRQALLAAAGGSVALLFGMPARATQTATDHDWRVIDAVQQQLFPDEADAPGARAIKALDYLKGQLPHLDSEDREFVLSGVNWLQQLAQEREGAGFTQLDPTQQARLLQQIARSRAGENWLSTLLTYVFEALLTAPAYAGNPGGVGWKWLHYVPGFPLADADTLYWKLPR
jgi:gluconate 2-dehydrogenase gamma chain